jgi:hypothetical protein
MPASPGVRMAFLSCDGFWGREPVASPQTIEPTANAANPKIAPAVTILRAMVMVQTP